MDDMRLAQKLVSLGHAARNSANLKVRQPLARLCQRGRHQRPRLARAQCCLFDPLQLQQATRPQLLGRLQDVLPLGFGVDAGSTSPRWCKPGGWTKPRTSLASCAP